MGSVTLGVLLTRRLLGGVGLVLLGRGVLASLGGGADFGTLGLLLLDVIEGHTDDGLLELDGALALLLAAFLSLALLVHAAPLLGPRELHSLLLLHVKGGGLVGDEHESLAILGNELRAAARVPNKYTL